MNKLIIIGNLTRDPELRTTRAGDNVCTFCVAVNRRVRQGEEPKADYFNVSAWRERGEICAKYLSKGKKVCVIGPVGLNTWDKDGKHGANLEVIAETVEFLSPRDRANTESSESSSAPKMDTESGMEVVETDELPF